MRDWQMTYWLPKPANSSQTDQPYYLVATGINLQSIFSLMAKEEKQYVRYILTYKPIIFGAILTFKLWGSAYTAHATQPESTVSMTAICQRCSLYVSHTRHGPLVGH